MKGDKNQLNNLILYEVYVRNHGLSGTFSDVTNDLERIRSLGVDVIWLMPIHPIGKTNKKGSLGCPYSIQDYRKVNPEYGTLEDFQELINRAHQLGMKVMIDVVYNHTSHDSTLVNEHPEFFHQDHQGKPITTVPAWSDVIDLKHPNPLLTKYLVDSLIYWLRLGVDGFRCDVASVLPIAFWLEAKAQVEAINPEIIWLAESVHTAWVIERREMGLTAHSDAELYQAFDLTYDYDIWTVWQAVVRGQLPVIRYLEMVEYQKGIFPHGYVKMRCVENHDNLRIMALAKDETSARAWTAFEVFNQGAFLLYAGQEEGTDHTPSLFDVDKIEWGDYPLQDWLTVLMEIKKSKIFSHSSIKFLSAGPMIQAAYQHQGQTLYGVFNIHSTSDPVDCQLPDGVYTDIISNEHIKVSNQKIELAGSSAAIFDLREELTLSPIDFELLKFSIN
jgi:glycosidase